MAQKFSEDYQHKFHEPWTSIKGIYRLYKYKELRYIYFGRKVSEKHNILWHLFCLHKRNQYGQRLGNEIDFKKIGGGVVLSHPFGITINPSASIGTSLTIFKGATIGSIRSGRNKGVPVIGDRVTICCNAFLCGNVRIGDDVLIGANSYVNFDVPPNSMVIGNPGKIIEKDNPSADYL
jgi:serine O-acetyltransferase